MVDSPVCISNHLRVCCPELVTQPPWGLVSHLSNKGSGQGGLRGICLVRLAVTQTSVASGDFDPQRPLGTPMGKGPLPGTDLKERACCGFLGSRHGCAPTALWVPGRLRPQAEDFKAFFPLVPCALEKGSRARFLRGSPAYSPTPQALRGVPWCQLPKDSEGISSLP